MKKTLLEARPDYGWLSEETEDNSDRLGVQRIFVVDPIDGTRGFLAGRSQWCVSVAVVENTLPVAGALECPVLDEHFTALLAGGAYLNGSKMPRLEGSTIGSITGSRKLIETMEAWGDKTLSVVPFVPSLAYRLAMVANRKLDAALARPGAHDWDLAAADVLLREVGGKLTDLDGNQRAYNQTYPRSGSLLASGEAAHGTLMELAKSGGFLH